MNRNNLQVLARFGRSAHGYEKNEVVDLVCVVKNELKATQLELDDINKEKESLPTKMMHI